MWCRRLRGLEELGKIAAQAIWEDTVSFISWYMDGRLLTVNPPFEKLTGYSRKELSAMNWPVDFATLQTRDSIIKAMEALDHGEIAYHHDEELIRKDGSHLFAEVFIHKYYPAEAGEPFYYSFIVDISERKHTEQEMEKLLKEIRESNEELSAITYIMESTTATLNLSELLNGILTRLNDALKADASGIYFKENGDVRAFASVGIEEEVKGLYSMPVGKGFAGKIVQTKKPLYIEDARTDPMVLSPFIKEKGIRSILSVPLIIDNDVVGVLYAGWLCIHPFYEREQHLIQAIAHSCASGILNAKLYEEAEDLRQQAQLYIDLMGHDINNMNQVGLGYLEISLDTMEKKYNIDKQDRVPLEKTLDALQNSSRLIDNVRKVQLARSGEIKPQIIDLGAVISDVISQYSHVQGRKVTINYTPVTGFYVEANDLLRDVFSNIVGNALKHSPSDKPLTIDIDVDKTREHNRDQYKISIGDNGPGLCDINKDELFIRFRRGKTKTKGRGLGLYLIKTLVESYHGKVWVEDRVPGDCSKGAKFIVMLPVSE
jgi:PAS domain S-box-containing protein